MPVPVFVSRPSLLSEQQEVTAVAVLRAIEELGLRPNTLPRSDYPREHPLRQVKELVGRCRGGVILGFEHTRLDQGILHPATAEETTITGPVPLPTPWNQLEAGMLFALDLPLLVLREDGVHGGIFDDGLEVFTAQLPEPGEDVDVVRESLRPWRDAVLAAARN